VGDRGHFSKPGPGVMIRIVTLLSPLPGRRTRPNQACVREIPGRRDPAPGFGLSSTQLLSRSRQAARHDQVLDNHSYKPGMTRSHSIIDWPMPDVYGPLQ
jgi:hypothetical protein